MTTIVLTEKAAYIDRQLTIRSLGGTMYQQRKILSIPEKGLHLFLLGATSYIRIAAAIISGEIPKLDLDSKAYSNENLSRTLIIGYDDEGHYYTFRITNTGEALKVTSSLYVVQQTFVHGSGGEFAMGSLIVNPEDYEKAFLTASIMDENTSSAFDTVIMGNRE